MVGTAPLVEAEAGGRPKPDAARDPLAPSPHGVDEVPTEEPRRGGVVIRVTARRVLTPELVTAKAVTAKTLANAAAVITIDAVTGITAKADIPDLRDGSQAANIARYD